MNQCELKKISLKYDTLFDLLVKTEPLETKGNLKKFIKFIDETPILSSFIQEKVKLYDYKDEMEDLFNKKKPYKIPDDNEDQEIAYIYQFLKYGVADNTKTDYLAIASMGMKRSSNYQEIVDTFNNKVIRTFNSYIRLYLDQQMNDHEQKTEGKTNITIHNSQFGGGVAGGDYKGDVTHNYAQQGNLAEAAAEIQQLLEQLSQTYPTNTTTEKMALATEAIKCIESNPTLMERILSALKAGGVSALEQALNHPAASFVIGALEDWQQTEPSKE